MNIETYIKSRAKDIAVYWGRPTNGADGSSTFAAPVEIKCVWEGQSFFTLSTVKEVSLRAKIHVTIDLDEQGMLYHGRLSDLNTAQKANPKKVPRAYEIKRFLKTPSLVTKNKYNRVAMTWYG